LFSLAVLKILTTSMTIHFRWVGGVFGPMVIVGCPAAVGLVCTVCGRTVAASHIFALWGMAGFFAGVGTCSVCHDHYGRRLDGHYGLCSLRCWVSTIVRRPLSSTDTVPRQLASRLDSPAQVAVIVFGCFLVAVYREISVGDVPLRTVRPVFRHALGDIYSPNSIANSRQNYFPVGDSARKNFVGIFVGSGLRPLAACFNDSVLAVGNATRLMTSTRVTVTRSG